MVDQGSQPPGPPKTKPKNRSILHTDKGRLRGLLELPHRILQDTDSINGSLNEVPIGKGEVIGRNYPGSCHQQSQLTQYIVSLEILHKFIQATLHSRSVSHTFNHFLPGSKDRETSA